jgi:polysaccharide export outer membrane protein
MVLTKPAPPPQSPAPPCTEEEVALGAPHDPPHGSGLPRELDKATHPDYVIEPPDVLRVDALRVVPKPPYRVQPLDALSIQVTETLPEAPIAGVYVVDPDGMVNLGFTYGPVSVIGMNLEEARKSIEARLKRVLKPGFQVTVTLAQSRGLQQIRGDHLVHQDGKVVLGLYGGVRVAGLTLEEAKAAIEAHLSRYLLNPEIALDISGFNSKVYYVVTDGGGVGEQVFRLPITGNETVLDALAQIYGLPPVASKDHIWVSRPTPGDADKLQVLPVDWRAIVQGGATRTNYQLLPGDRIYVKAQPLVRADNFLARLFSPVERILGITLLGSTTVNSISGRNGGSGTNR